MHRSMFRTAAITIVFAITLSGCATSDVNVSVSTVSAAQVPEGYLCAGREISGDALEVRAPISELSASGRAALESAVVDDGTPWTLPDLDDWFVAFETDERIGFVRELDTDIDVGSGEAPHDSEVAIIMWVGDAPNVSPGWYLSSSSTCALTIDLGELSPPSIFLAEPIDPSSREVQLLVTEQNCNSGDDAEGRIEVVRMEETEDSVALVVGVRARGGGQTCQGNPATPFTITLAEPIGNREIINAVLAKPRPLTVAPDGTQSTS